MKKNIISAIAIVIIVVVLAIFVYVWGFCRFYVPPEYMAIVTAKNGKTPAATFLP